MTFLAGLIIGAFLGRRYPDWLEALDKAMTGGVAR